jgi:hypothetical protein
MRDAFSSSRNVARPAYLRRGPCLGARGGQGSASSRVPSDDASTEEREVVAALARAAESMAILT